MRIFSVPFVENPSVFAAGKNIPFPLVLEPVGENVDPVIFPVNKLLPSTFNVDDE